MESCYTYSLKTFDKGIFDRTADATYIIHLEGNGRYDGIMKQLEKYHPTKLVYIAFNKGYKKCKKNLKRDLPRYDLTDAFLNVFKHAVANGYNNILVLEDDFIFSELVLDPVVQSRVNSFIKDRGDTSFMYLLGCLPILQIPYDNYHNYIKSAGTHAVIYSKKFIENTLKRDQSSIDDWDLDSNWNANRFTYYKPLCHQTFPLTENRKSWHESTLLLFIIDIVFRAVNLNREVEPGYTIFNIISKLLFLIPMFLLGWFLFNLKDLL
jgi:hypothetical protein